MNGLIGSVSPATAAHAMMPWHIRCDKVAGEPFGNPKGKHVETTMIYTHVANLGTLAVRSPLDLVAT